MINLGSILYSSLTDLSNQREKLLSSSLQAVDGGRYCITRYKTFLKSSEPDIDETILIESSLNVTSQVKFNLNFA